MVAFIVKKRHYPWHYPWQIIRLEILDFKIIITSIIRNIIIAALSFKYTIECIQLGSTASVHHLINYLCFFYHHRININKMYL